MEKHSISRLAAALFVPLALSACAGLSAPGARVQLEVAGPPIAAELASDPFRYRMPARVQRSEDEEIPAQRWSMLGREDLSAASGSAEYAPAECAALPGSPRGWDEVIDAIASRAAGHRIVIVNESHSLTRHRETTRRLLAKLRPLGFTVFAAETFNISTSGSAVEQHADLGWPHMFDGFYSAEPSFGRVLREAKALGYRLAAYEEIFDRSDSLRGEPAEIRREAEEARHLAEILRRMRPDERLVVHVGYGHGAEVPTPRDYGNLERMGGRLKALTGIDPLTIDQTACRTPDGPAFLAQPPATVRPGAFDMIVSHPVEGFAGHRPIWRREAGDIPIPVPSALRPTGEPLVIETFAWDEPFEAVPVDRVFVEPGEDVPLLLPPGRYRVRAVRMAKP